MVEYCGGWIEEGAGWWIVEGRVECNEGLSGERRINKEVECGDA